MATRRVILKIDIGETFFSDEQLLLLLTEKNRQWRYLPTAEGGLFGPVSVEIKELQD